MNNWIELFELFPENALSGSALVFFRVNRSPSSGECTINEFEGIELDTEFFVFCQEWVDRVSDMSFM